jgi:hypothetical protein
MARQGRAWQGKVFTFIVILYDKQGEAWQGLARLGMAGHGKARQGSYPLIFKRKINKIETFK